MSIGYIVLFEYQSKMLFIFIFMLYFIIIVLNTQQKKYILFLSIKCSFNVTIWLKDYRNSGKIYKDKLDSIYHKAAAQLLCYDNLHRISVLLTSKRS